MVENSAVYFGLFVRVLLQTGINAFRITHRPRWPDVGLLTSSWRIPVELCQSMTIILQRMITYVMGIKKYALIIACLKGGLQSIKETFPSDEIS